VIEEFNPALVVLDSETLAVGKHDEPLRLEPTELAQHNGAVALVRGSTRHSPALAVRAAVLLWRFAVRAIHTGRLRDLTRATDHQ
jgi:hypothetical protein